MRWDSGCVGWHSQEAAPVYKLTRSFEMPTLIFRFLYTEAIWYIVSSPFYTCPTWGRNLADKAHCGHKTSYLSINLASKSLICAFCISEVASVHVAVYSYQVRLLIFKDLKNQQNDNGPLTASKVLHQCKQVCTGCLLHKVLLIQLWHAHDLYINNQIQLIMSNQEVPVVSFLFIIVTCKRVCIYMYACFWHPQTQSLTSFSHNRK